MHITTLSNTLISAEIKSLGAELCSLKNNSNQEYIWEGNPDFWGKHSPVLFPIVGTLKNNTFHHEGRNYQLSRHGFARDMDFDLVEKTESTATFLVQSNADTLEKYPFEFELQIKYSLVKTTLEIQYSVINKSNSRIPFSIGAHPAFSLSGNFENYNLVFGKKETLEYNLLENGLITDQTEPLQITENRLPLTYKLFEKDALVFKKLESNSLTIFEKENPVLKVNFEDFPNLGIWTIVGAPFLCIEPWFGYSDTTESTGNLFEKEGIIILKEKDTFQAKFSIEIL